MLRYSDKKKCVHYKHTNTNANLEIHASKHSSTSIMLKTGHIMRKMTFDAPVFISSMLS